MKLTSYLIFNGQAEEAANFYADVLGGKIENRTINGTSGTRGTC